MICLLLVLSLILPASSPAYAAQGIPDTINSEISAIICDLLCKSLAHSSYTDILSDNNTTLYLCNPISPYQLIGEGPTINTDIEYYLIKANAKYVACITICYANGAFASASFGTDISATLNHNEISNNSFALVGHSRFL